MAKRTAEISPNSERAKNKFKKSPTDNPDPSTSKTTTGAPPAPTPTPTGATATTATDKTAKTTATTAENQGTASTPVKTPRDRFEKSDLMHCSMNSIPDVSPVITRHSAFVSPPLTHIDIEIYKKDDAIFDAILPRDVLKQLWVDLGRNLEEVRNLSFFRNPRKYLKVLYNLRDELPVLEVTKTYEITFEAKIGSKTHHFRARFPQFKEIVCELGQLVTVTVYNIPPGIDCEDLRQWIELFGTIKGNFR
jgi:hypothetical protein